MLMGDDGVGPATVEALRRRGEDRRAELIDAGLAFSEVLCDLEPDQPMVIVDALAGGGPPGAVYRLDLAELVVADGAPKAAISLHEVSILPALHMAALAGRGFTNVTIFGIEPETVMWQMKLSEAAAAGVERVVQAVGRYLDQVDGPSDLAARALSAAHGSENR